MSNNTDNRFIGITNFKYHMFSLYMWYLYQIYIYNTPLLVTVEVPI